MASKTIQRFRSAYDHKDDINDAFCRAITPCGRGIKDEYGYEIDTYGRKILVKTGETNLYAQIQESLEETKIENILARAAIGDTSVFRPDGIYADLTEMPNNMIEARQAMQKMENMWYGLSQEIRNKYNNDLDEFIGASGSEKWLRDMGLLAAKEQIQMESTAAKPETTELKGETNE